MIQTGLIQNAHSDLVTDVSYDFYGLRLATCGLDQRIKIWQLDESTGTWTVEDDWKAHDAAVAKLSWAHPEFGSIVASGSFDRTVKIWEQTNSRAQQVNGAGSESQPGTSWVERAVLVDARGTVRVVEFAPHHFGLKLATISSDNTLRIYECLEQPALTIWQLSEEVDMLTISRLSSPFLGGIVNTNTNASFLSLSRTVAPTTPTQTSATLEGPSATLVAQALHAQGSFQQQQQARPGVGNREADGGWCLSWCKDRYWGEIIAVGSGIDGTIKIIQINPSRRPTTLLTLDPLPPQDPTPPHTAASTSHTPTSSRSLSSHPLTAPVDATPGSGSSRPIPQAITSVSWAPSCGRSYHLIATGGRDGHVRIWRVKPGASVAEEEEEDDEERMDVGRDGARWSASVVADFDQHQSSVGRVEWNITGTVLSSAGNDGRVRLWKATSGSIWRPAGSLGVEQTEEPDQQDQRDGEGRERERDVDMDRSA